MGWEHSVTGITTIVLLVAKFVEGAWITLLFHSSDDRFLLPLSGATIMQSNCLPPAGIPSIRPSEPASDRRRSIDRWSNITCQGIQLPPGLSRSDRRPCRAHEHSELLQDDWNNT